MERKKWTESERGAKNRGFSGNREYYKDLQQTKTLHARLEQLPLLLAAVSEEKPRGSRLLFRLFLLRLSTKAFSPFLQFCVCALLTLSRICTLLVLFCVSILVMLRIYTFILLRRICICILLR